MEIEKDIPNYTYEDYKRWEGRWELLKGIPYAMTPLPGRKHQRISQKIAWQLEELLKECNKCEAYLPVDWKIEENTIVQPDNLVVCSEKNWEHYLEKTPILIFEILSKSTEKKDKILKYKLYEKAGVKYYIIINPEDNSFDIFILKNNRYEKEKNTKLIYSFDLEYCKIEFNFTKIF